MAHWLRRPNTRVQRTRSSASPPHSPLSFGTLGGCESPSAARLGQPATRVEGAA